MLLRLAALVSALACVASAQQPLRAQAAVESDRVYVGQAFGLQIKVSGSDSPQPPNMSPLMADFSYEDAGGGANNSQSITIINGRMTRTVDEGYTFNYQLTPKRAGVLAIPSLTIQAGSQTARTQPMRIQALPPSEIEDFKLRQELSAKRIYLGQPVMLTTTWYIGRNVDQFNFQVPVLEDPRFESFDPKHNAPPAANSDYFDAPVNDTRVTARKGRGTIDGFSFVTVTFEKLLAPRQAGKIELPAATVAFRARASMRRSPSLFDDFFSGGMFGTRTTFESFAIPSNRPVLEVLPLPEQGRPADFSGLIGQFAFEASATPTDVNVGDPITLTVRVSGPEYLDLARLPNFLTQGRLTADFKVPDDMAPGEMQGRSKVFTQTIRARTARAAEVPPLEFNFFDPEKGEYVTAATAPIPLTVHGSRIVTAADAEGLGPAGSAQTAIESQQGGIAQNYEALDALRNRSIGLLDTLRSPLWLLVLFGPPLAFVGLWSWTALRRRADDPRQKAVAEASARLESLLAEPGSQDRFADELMERLRAYLGARLELPPGALTFADVRGPLAARGLEPSALDDLRAVFEACEASRYAGGVLGADSAASVRDKTRRALAAIEKTLGGGR
ncbi:MAG: hypothetical protein GC160_06010 [Acidobacteria bacterium]|nr:hypothetical protein [Acidobacteriota bacterium]